MNYTDVVKILQKAVTPLTSLPIKYINTNIKPPSNGKWWEIIILPLDMSNEFLGNEQTYKGVMRLILHWKQNNKGVYEPLEEAEKMLKGFPKGSSFDGVRIISNPRIDSVIEEPSELLIPLTIEYLCFNV